MKAEAPLLDPLTPFVTFSTCTIATKDTVKGEIVNATKTTKNSNATV